MIVRKLLVAAALASPLLVAAIAPTPAAAQASFDLRIGTPPPPPRTVFVPPPRRGWVWAPGYWAWNGRRHVWYDGHWERERRGYRYVPPEWREDGGQYGFRRGGWER